MKRMSPVRCCFLVLGLFFVMRPTMAADVNPWSHELLFQLVDRPLTAEELTAVSDALAEAETLRSLAGVPGTFLVTTAHERDQRRVLAQLRASSAVAAAQPNKVYRSSFAPNDPQFPNQWNFTSVRVPSAWDLDTIAPLYGGDPSIIVAVVDSGFTSGPDYATTPTVAGYDYVNNDADPRDDNGHGTHVAGTILQNTNNGTAGAGIAYASTLMPIKVLDTSGTGSTATITQGVTFAHANGAKVINLSLGGNEDDPILHTAIINAKNDGVVLVAAVGNDGASTVSYPARYDEVISVGGVRFDETKASYSNTGTGLDLAAPGGDLTVDQNGDGQVDGILQQTCVNAACGSHASFLYAGTSQAAPHVAAAAALMLAAGADRSQIQNVLQTTAKDLGTPGYDETYGYGLLDVTAALTAVVSDTTPPTGSVTIEGGAEQTASLSVVLSLSASDATGIASMAFSNGVTFSVPEAYATSKLWDMSDAATGGSTAEGVRTVTVRFTDAKGNSAAVSDTIVLDRTGPTGVAINGFTAKDHQRSIASGTAVTLARGHYTFSASDPAGVSGYFVAFSKSATADPQTAGTFQSDAAYVPDQVDPGTWYLRIRAKDTLGNLSAIVEFVFVRQTGYVVSAPLSGRGSTLRFLNATTKRTTRTIDVFGPRFTGGLSVAQGDLDGDGTVELVAVPARGATNVTVLTADGEVVTRFFAYASSFRGGAHVAVGDVDGDGAAEILTVPVKGTAHVSLFTAAGESINRFFAFPGSYRGGAWVAVADLDADGVSEILVGRHSGQAEVKVFNAEGEQLQRWFPYGKRTRVGVTVAAGDVNGDGATDVVVARTKKCQARLLTATGKRTKSFKPYGSSFEAGCAISLGDVDGDGKDELIFSPLSTSGQVRVLHDNGKRWTAFSYPKSKGV
ncbi:MAG: S8 family serine peptidase, partial [Candidatus Kerfeldbacteria bacterium]|nr:S8 family serine peptidase [Candidatus Kerfeldbacteria bacterium]